MWLCPNLRIKEANGLVLDYRSREVIKTRVSSSYKEWFLDFGREDASVVIKEDSLSFVGGLGSKGISGFRTRG